MWCWPGVTPGTRGRSSSPTRAPSRSAESLAACSCSSELGFGDVETAVADPAASRDRVLGRPARRLSPVRVRRPAEVPTPAIRAVWLEQAGRGHRAADERNARARDLRRGAGHVASDLGRAVRHRARPAEAIAAAGRGGRDRDARYGDALPPHLAEFAARMRGRRRRVGLTPRSLDPCNALFLTLVHAVRATCSAAITPRYMVGPGRGRVRRGPPRASAGAAVRPPYPSWCGRS